MLHRSLRTYARLVLPAAFALASPLAGQAPCAESPGFDRLDFWVGDWDVFAGEQQVGTNRIEKVLNGCAIMEEWRGGTGGEGRSLFYLLPWSGQWKQVWVTSTATRTGGVKEKDLVSVGEDGSVQFQGRIPDAAGVLWYDRTTLTPLDGGEVRQVIEISRDGTDWQVTFDAVYRRRSGAG